MQKYDLREITKIWKQIYGENFKTEYSGFYNFLKTKSKNKNKLAITQYDNQVILFENINGKDYEIENFKSINACTRFINKHYKRLDKYNIDKDYGIYKKL